MEKYENQIINPNTKSKINLIAFLMLIVGVLGLWGVFDQETIDKIEKTVMVLGPTTIIIFRSFFTGRKRKE